MSWHTEIDTKLDMWVAVWEEYSPSHGFKLKFNFEELMNQLGLRQK